MTQKEKYHDLLQLVGEAMGAGVIVCTPELHALNRQMRQFEKNFGGLSAFDIQKEDSVERVLNDIYDNKRVFSIVRVLFGNESILLVRDITEIKSHTDALERLVMYDPLTDLPNRTLFHDRLHQAILSGQRENKTFAVLMMDLDHFKEINDTLGHQAGDMVLKEISERLKKVLRESDTVARLGGDEFAVLLPGTDAGHAEQTALKLLNSLSKPVVLDANTLYLNMSVGYVLFPDHGRDPDTLIKRADVAMYVAKQSQSGVSGYNPVQDQHSVRHLALMNELRDAITSGALTLYYQPKVELKSGIVYGVEALARWQHVKRNLILPDEFIPLAERSGLIKPLTMWALSSAMHQCSEWHRMGIDINISVNLSTRNLQDTKLSDDVVERLRKWGINPSWLELEITEGAMMSEPARALEILMQLDALGVRLSIDDFGKGYSSLAYLKRLPVSEIKIDKSFVMNMAVDENDALIVHSTIELAHNLGLRVLAEGVDSEETWITLNNLGCDSAQGNYISPPIPAREFTAWLTESGWGVLKKGTKEKPPFRC